MKNKFCITAVNKSSELESGAAGSGRFPTDTGHAAADELTHAAEKASRYARRDNTASAHEMAGDVHFKAGKEHAGAGNDERAEQHFQKSAAHYKTAKALSGCSMAASDANDKSRYDQLRKDNLSEGGGAAGGDILGQKDSSGQIVCPLCTYRFNPEETVTGGNDTLTTCPRCTGSFRMASHD